MLKPFKRVGALAGISALLVAAEVGAVPSVDGYTQRTPSGTSSEYTNFEEVLWYSNSPYSQGNPDQRTAVFWEFVSGSGLFMYLEAPITAKAMVWGDDSNYLGGFDENSEFVIQDLIDGGLITAAQAAIIEPDTGKWDESVKLKDIPASFRPYFEGDAAIAQDELFGNILNYSGAVGSEDIEVNSSTFGDKVIEADLAEDYQEPLDPATYGGPPTFDGDTSRVVEYADSVSYVRQNRGCDEVLCDAADVPMSYEFLFSGFADAGAAQSFVESIVDINFHLSPAGDSGGSRCNIPGDPTCDTPTGPNGGSSVPAPPALALMALGLCIGGRRRWQLRNAAR